MEFKIILLIILAAGLAIGLAAFQYAKSSGSQKTKLLLASLRFTTYFSLGVLLINPKFNRTTYTLEKANLVLAVDNSSSIDHLNEAQTVSRIVDSILDNNALRDKFDIQQYSFGNKVRSNDSLSFLENQTNIASIFNELDEVYSSKVAPTILITDGNQTFGEAYQYSAERYEHPVLPIVVGDTTTYKDLAISQVNTNRYAFLNNKFPIEVFSKYTGDDEVVTNLEVLQNGRIVYKQTLQFSSTKTSRVTQITLPVNSIGLKTYTVRLGTLQNEKNSTNNTKRFGIEVIDERTNILILSSILHPDLGALKKAIESNEQRQVTIKKVDDTNIVLGDYQLVVLYQPKANFEQYMDELQDLGVNSFIITGTVTEYQFLNEAQQIFNKELSSQQENYQAAFNINYNTFQLENIGFSKFPPLKDSFGEITVNGAYNTILHQVISGVETEQPLLITSETNTQRNAILFGEGIWRWRAQSFLEANSFENFDNFVGKITQYLASKKRRNRLDVDYKSFYDEGDNIRIAAHYFDKNYVFDDSANISMVLIEKETKARRNIPLILKNNRYEVDLSSLPSGSYSFTVSVANETLSRSGSFEIIEFNAEKQFLNANVTPLRQIATNKGEKLYFKDDTSTLITNLLANESYNPIQKQQNSITPLINWYYLLGVIVLALSLEWFIRKYNGLI